MILKVLQPFAFYIQFDNVNLSKLNLHLLSACTNVDFALDRRHLGNTRIKINFILDIALNLHYLCTIKASVDVSSLTHV